MIYRLHYALCLAAMVGVSGCARWRSGGLSEEERPALRAGPVTAHAARQSHHASEEDEGDPWLDPDLEKRAEANARYLTGLTLELNQQPEKALDEFYASALVD